VPYLHLMIYHDSWLLSYHYRLVVIAPYRDREREMMIPPAEHPKVAPLARD